MWGVSVFLSVFRSVMQGGTHLLSVTPETFTELLLHVLILHLLFI